MPVYPIFRCKGCGCAVQLESHATKGMFPSHGFHLNTLFSGELDSDEFAKYCRGQGRFYAEPPRSLYASPVNANHFNYSGIFQEMCCYCALGEGLCAESFRDIGCYHCKRRYMAITEFGKLKRRRVGESGLSVWNASGWAGLSDALIDHILGMLVGDGTKLVSQE